MKSINLKILFLIIIIDALGVGILVPLLPSLSLHLGLSKVQLGLVVSSFGFAQAVTSVVFGYISDRVGRRRIIYTTTIVLAFSYIATGYAQDFVQLLIVRLIAGICAGNVGVLFAAVSDYSTPDKKARNMGLTGTAFGTGFILGPTIGGFLAGNSIEDANFALPGIISGIAALFAGLMCKKFMLHDHMKFLKRGKTTQFGTIKNSFLRVLGNAQTMTVYLILILFSISFVGLEVFVIVWTSELFGWTPKINGIYFAYFALITTISELTYSFLVPNKSKLIFNMLMFGAATAALVIAQSPKALVLVTIPIAAGMGAIFPIINASLAYSGEEKEQGLTFGISQTISTVGRSIGPILFGVVYQLYDANALWIFSGALTVVTTLVVIAFYRSPKNLTIQHV